MAYIGGFSSGMLEIASSLGDNYDLVGEKELFTSFRDSQYRLTTSAIKSIKKYKLNNLGKIE